MFPFLLDHYVLEALAKQKATEAALIETKRLERREALLHYTGLLFDANEAAALAQQPYAAQPCATDPCDKYPFRSAEYAYLGGTKWKLRDIRTGYEVRNVPDRAALVKLATVMLRQKRTIRKNYGFTDYVFDAFLGE